MKEIELIATCAAGIEAMVKEVLNLGFKDIMTENGKVTFKGDLSSIAKLIFI